MKKSIVFAAIAAIPFVSFAQSANTITFRGEVSQQTCSVAVNGNASSPLVLLPTVSTADLAAAGSTAGQTEFTVSVSGCTANVTSQPINTVFLPNSVTASGNIANTGTATNVSLQLLDPAAPAAPFQLTGGHAAPGCRWRPTRPRPRTTSRCATSPTARRPRPARSSARSSIPWPIPDAIPAQIQ